MPNKQNPNLIPKMPNLDSQNSNLKDQASKNSATLNPALLRYCFLNNINFFGTFNEIIFT